MDAIITVAQPERARRFAQEGVTIPPTSRLPIPVADLTPASRALLAGWSPALDEVHLVLPPHGKFGGGRPTTAWPAPLLPETPADWETLISAFGQAVADHAAAERAVNQAAIDKALTEADQHPTAVPYLPSGREYAGVPGFDRLRQIMAERKAAIEAKRLAEDTARRERHAAQKAAQQAAADARDAAKRAWVAEHGSDYLKRAVGAGYDCQRQYVTERAAREHPGYQVAFDGLEYRSRSCPSETALAEAERVDGLVVWLTEPVRSDDESYEFEPCEAVIIEDYLDTYTLIRLM